MPKITPIFVLGGDEGMDWPGICAHIRHILALPGVEGAKVIGSAEALQYAFAEEDEGYGLDVGLDFTSDFFGGQFADADEEAVQRESAPTIPTTHTSSPQHSILQASTRRAAYSCCSAVPASCAWWRRGTYASRTRSYSAGY